MSERCPYGLLHEISFAAQHETITGDAAIDACKEIAELAMKSINSEEVDNPSLEEKKLEILATYDRVRSHRGGWRIAVLLTVPWTAVSGGVELGLSPIPPPVIYAAHSSVLLGSTTSGLSISSIANAVSNEIASNRGIIRKIVLPQELEAEIPYYAYNPDDPSKPYVRFGTPPDIPCRCKKQPPPTLDM